VKRTNLSVLTKPQVLGPAGDDVAIAVDHVSVSYGDRSRPGHASLAVDDVSFAVRSGEFLVLLGPSGCGKSTLLKIIADLLPPSLGTVSITPAGGADRVGFVFQSDALLPWRTALQNVTLSVQLGGHVRRSVAAARGHELMEQLGLGNSCDKFPSQLSGGMRKRVALARAFAYQPAVFLMDEPFGALDAQTRIKVGNFLLELLRDSSQTTVFVTHDIDEAVALADRIIVMTRSPGRIAGIVDVDLPRPRDYYETRFTDGFREIQREVWELLEHGARDD
jgi:NitT/TauT family transport system ATP-binding protein